MTWADPSIKVVIAIDFGTSRSGYAYSFYDNPDEIVYKSDWVVNAPYPKTRTCLLYTPDDKLEAWGDAAVSRLAQLRQTRETGYYFVDRFKMQIRNEDGKYRDNLNEIFKTPVSNKEINVIDLVIDYLRSLKDKALSDALKSTVQDDIQAKEIRWVLTVPAIWTDADKQFMRQVAVKANLISSSDDDDNRLLFALEPEAAAFYCNRQGELSQDSGTFMILDCGGGTVDITTYKISSDEKFQGIEGVLPTGGEYGSTFVDTQFRKLLADKISPQALDRFHTKNPWAFLQQMTDWEITKCGITSENIDYPTNIVLNRGFEKILKEDNEINQLFQKLIEKQRGDDENIVLSSVEIKALFEPTLNGLIKETYKEFKYLENKHKNLIWSWFNRSEEDFGSKACDAILLVGGYSKSVLLQNRVKQEFSDRVRKIVIPRNPEAAVLIGAVYFGINPDVWVSRVSKRTYGCATSRVFKQGDPVSKKYYSKTKQIDYCTGVFDVFASAGELIGSNISKFRPYSSIEDDATTIRFEIFSTEDPDPKFVDDPNVVMHKSETFKRTDINKGTKWNFELTMYFGRTEIEIKIKDTNSGETKNLKIDFRTKYL